MKSNLRIVDYASNKPYFGNFILPSTNHVICLQCRTVLTSQEMEIEVKTGSHKNHLIWMRDSNNDFAISIIS